MNILTNPLLANFLRFTDQNGSSLIRYRADTYNIEAQHTVDFGTANRLTYGFNYRYNSLSDNHIMTNRTMRIGWGSMFRMNGRPHRP